MEMCGLQIAVPHILLKLRVVFSEKCKYRCVPR